MAKSTVLPPPIKRGTPAVPPSAPRPPPRPKVSTAANTRMTGYVILCSFINNGIMKANCQRFDRIRMIVMSVPLLAVSSYILYKRSESPVSKVRARAQV
ncbi:hypothetical protein LIPSTDRAFT_216000 [Lipomyces starkeyi NRRL Y-11557]|uniref:Uncharacterized protein n=1 Tax=Lipomyces starkeyi NRRL Y-11557 TaxID=675824 RepID=A0A1E3QDK6_LIPST|nr:hypothetical protein LIPSTDRAFT_216000 [Lipomyces starkeyi NRRL Y-11557]